MSETISFSVIANSNFMDDWLLATNQLINLMATDVVTANSVAGGSQTNGNGFVNGIFGANTLVATNLSGGNVAVQQTLNLTSNLVSGNLSINSFALGLGSSFSYAINVETSGVSAQLVDSWSSLNSSGGEYVLVATQNPANGYAISRINLLTDGTSALITEYGQMQTNGAVGTFSANMSAATVQLWFTPAFANCQVKGQATQVSI